MAGTCMMRWMAVFGLLLAAANAGAQSMEPRFYSNAPVGMNFLLGGYAYSEGSFAADPSVRLENAELDLHLLFAGYAHSFGLWGKSGKFDVVVPYGFLSGTATVNGAPVKREVDGFTDPSFRVSMNFVGAPALALPEFKEYRQDFVAGVSLQVLAPLGQYDSSRVVNLGSNRWVIKPEVGMSKPFGPVSLEVAGAVAFFTDNTDFYGGQNKRQDPLYSAQGHLVYTFKNGIWAAVDGTYYAGGGTTINGLDKHDRQDNTRAGATLAFPVNKANSIKLFASTGVSTRVGSDFDTYGMAWQYRWGGGL
ncbi:MAG: transporter [Kiritimatiellales bacterium]|nr:transporter [Kiritimatiellales bacterium]MCF7864793.1 transporter [Kiritimatiellales bacterium]